MDYWVDEGGALFGTMGKMRPPKDPRVLVTFENIDVEDARLYFEDKVRVPFFVAF